MVSIFVNSEILDCDCFVADYSEFTNNEKKVVISKSPLHDIAHFHLQKRRKTDRIPYLAVNLEEYPHFIKGIQNCECVFKTVNQESNTWVMFLELKYCKEENTEAYCFKAFSQMKETLEKLEAMESIERNRHNIYFVYCAPEHLDQQPFGAWTISQNDTLKELESSGIHLLGYCKMLIGTPHHLFPPKIKE